LFWLARILFPPVARSTIPVSLSSDFLQLYLELRFFFSFLLRGEFSSSYLFPSLPQLRMLCSLHTPRKRKLFLFISRRVKNFLGLSGRTPPQSSLPKEKACPHHGFLSLPSSLLFSLHVISPNIDFSNFSFIACFSFPPHGWGVTFSCAFSRDKNSVLTSLSPRASRSGRLTRVSSGQVGLLCFLSD